MPTPGQIAPKSRRALENIAVAGPSTAAELNKLDPTAPDHRQTLKQLENAKYVVAEYKINNTGPTAYSLTQKARKLLADQPIDDTTPAHLAKPDASKPAAGKAATSKRRFALPKRANVAGPVIHGSLSTGRLTQACADMLAPAVRPGAEQSLQIPSRDNDVLHYRDGRIVPIHTTA